MRAHVRPRDQRLELRRQLPKPTKLSSAVGFEHPHDGADGARRLVDDLAVSVGELAGLGWIARHDQGGNREAAAGDQLRLIRLGGVGRHGGHTIGDAMWCHLAPLGEQSCDRRRARCTMGIRRRWILVLRQ